MKRMTLVIIILALAFQGCNKVEKNEFGKITAITGTAEVYQNGKGTWTTAKVLKIVQFGDSVRTKAESEVTVEFGENTVTLNENTTIAVTDTVDSGTIHRVTVFDNCGEVLSDINKLGGDNRYEVRTPTAVAAVRGTHFVVFFAPDSRMTDVRVLEGRVWAFNPFIPLPPVILLPGFCTIIHLHEAPFEPVPMNYGQFKKMERLLGGRQYGRYLKKFKLNRRESNMFLPIVPLPPGQAKHFMKGPGQMFGGPGDKHHKGGMVSPVLVPMAPIPPMHGMPGPQGPGQSPGKDQKKDGKKGGGKRK